MNKCFVTTLVLLGLISSSAGQNNISNEGNSSIQLMKLAYKADLTKNYPTSGVIVGIGDRIEADAMLELADEPYIDYIDFSNYEVRHLPKVKRIFLYMPRIDLLKQHIRSLASSTEEVYVFLMEGDKLDSEYGDRSYETYLKIDLASQLPSNVKVIRLKNESVTGRGIANNFEIGDITQSLVYKNQIEPIFKEANTQK